MNYSRKSPMAEKRKWCPSSATVPIYRTKKKELVVEPAESDCIGLIGPKGYRKRVQKKTGRNCRIEHQTEEKEHNLDPRTECWGHREENNCTKITEKTLKGRGPHQSRENP